MRHIGLILATISISALAGCESKPEPVSAGFMDKILEDAIDKATRSPELGDLGQQVGYLRSMNLGGHNWEEYHSLRGQILFMSGQRFQLVVSYDKDRNYEGTPEHSYKVDGHWEANGPNNYILAGEKTQNKTITDFTAHALRQLRGPEIHLWLTVPDDQAHVMTFEF